MSRSRLRLASSSGPADAHHLRRLLDQLGEVPLVVGVAGGALRRRLALADHRHGGRGGHGADRSAVGADHDDLLLLCLAVLAALGAVTRLTGGGLLLAHASTLGGRTTLTG